MVVALPTYPHLYSRAGHYLLDCIFVRVNIPLYTKMNASFIHVAIGDFFTVYFVDNVGSAISPCG